MLSSLPQIGLLEVIGRGTVFLVLFCFLGFFETCHLSKKDEQVESYVAITHGYSIAQNYLPMCGAHVGNINPNIWE